MCSKSMQWKVAFLTGMHFCSKRMLMKLGNFWKESLWQSWNNEFLKVFCPEKKLPWVNETWYLNHVIHTSQPYVWLLFHSIVSHHCFTPYHLRKNIVKNWIQLHACAQDIYCLDQEVFENLDAEKASGPVLTRFSNLMSYLTTGHYPSQVKCWKGSYIIKLLNVITPNAKLINAFFTKEMDW